MGLAVGVDVFKTGRGGDPTSLGLSYVELDITGSYMDDGQEEEAYTTVKFFAGGYGGPGGSKNEFGGGDGLREMKTKAMAYILKDLTSSGWKKP